MICYNYSFIQTSVLTVFWFLVDEPGTGCLPHTSTTDDEDSSSIDEDYEHGDSGSQLGMYYCSYVTSIVV